MLNNLKKINPKVTKIVLAIMGILLAGGATLAIKDGLGDPSAGPSAGAADDTGLF